MLGPHAAFIVAAYGVSALVLVLVVGWIAIEHRALKRTLADFEARGVTRRSDASRS